MAAGGGIEWLGIFADAAPNACIASHAAVRSSARHESVLATVFASPGWAAVLEDNRSKLELKSGKHVYCIERASPRAYVCVVSEAFPTRLIFSGSGAAPRAMAALRAAADEALAAAGAARGGAAEAAALKRALKSGAALGGVAAAFADPEAVDKVGVAARKVKDLQASLHVTLLKATERDTLLEDLGDKSKGISASAKLLFEGAGAVRRGVQCRYYRCVALIVFAVLAVAAAVVVGVNYEYTHWWR